VTPDDRRRRVLARAGLPADAPFAPAAGATNEVWIGDAVVVRIGHLGLPGGQLGRLAREAAIVARVPREARYPELVDVGSDSELAWIVTRRVPGVPLARAWPGLAASERERAVHELAAALGALHATPCAGIPDDIRPPHTLPLAPLLELCDDAAAAGADAGLMRALADLVRARWPAFDTADTGLVHGDPHLGNVLWHAGHVSAVLDLEWSRPSWIHCDLEILLDQPGVDRADIARWLRAARPGWFAHPRLADRLAVLFVSRMLGCYQDEPNAALPRVAELRALVESAP